MSSSFPAAVSTELASRGLSLRELNVLCITIRFPIRQGVKEYPNILVLTSLHDSQVQYWEPAKWVAKLRAIKTDRNRLLLRTKMEAGHGGVSGRFNRFKETAFAYAFILDLVGIRQ